MAHRMRGFTLLEIIGVVAIVAILSAVLAPSVVSSINRAYATAEDANLQQLANALRDTVRRTRSIPSTAIGNWTTALAAQTEYTAAQLRFNRRNRQRVLLADPRFFTPVETPFNGYAQTGGLANPPNSPRLMLVSNMTGNVPAVPNTAAAFDAIWNQAAGAALIESPDLKIERIFLGDLFHTVLLTNSNTSASAVALDGNAALAIPAGVMGADGSLQTVVIDGTQVRLFGPPFPGGALLTSFTATRDVSRAFTTDGSSWFWDAL